MFNSCETSPNPLGSGGKLKGIMLSLHEDCSASVLLLSQEDPDLSQGQGQVQRAGPEDCGSYTLRSVQGAMDCIRCYLEDAESLIVVLGLELRFGASVLSGLVRTEEKSTR